MHHDDLTDKSAATTEVRTLWRAVLLLGAGPRVSGSSGAGADCSPGYRLSHRKLQLHLLGLRTEGGNK